MNIIEINSFMIENGIAHVQAVLEDVRRIYPQTLWSPAEYGPGLCHTSFDVDQADTIPIHYPDLIEYLESIPTEWKLIPDQEFPINCTMT